MFIKKKAILTEFDQLLAKAFTRRNLFVATLDDMVNISPSKKSIQEWILKIDEDKAFTEDFYLHRIRVNREIFTLNYESKDYLILLLNTHELLSKCASIVYSKNTLVENYLHNELTETVYLLEQIDKGLRQGVPLHHETIEKAVESIYQLISEALDNYYKLSIEPLENEIKLAKELRLEYTRRREILLDIPEDIITNRLTKD